MKKLIIALVNLLIITSVCAQSPQSFKYQAIARDVNGDVLAEQNVSLRISILKTSATGTLVYKETHSEATNQFGLINLNIGTGTPVTGDFTTIDWANDKYFIKVEMDPAGGTAYQIMGTSQLLSVPYALYAKESGNQNYQVLSISNDTIYLTNGGFVKLPADHVNDADADSTNEIQDLSNVLIQGNDAGANNIVNTGAIGIGTGTPDASADLEINSTNKGVLFPRMTTTQRDAIDVTGNPNSVLIFNTTTECFEFYYNGSWYNIACTLPPFTCGTSTVDDPDGYTYNTVLIGSQCWLAEDLRYDGSTTGNGCRNVTWVDNSDEGWCGYYTGGPFANEGLLYQWSAAMNGSTTPGSQGLCPTGWHIPTDAEYCTLEQQICSDIGNTGCATTFDCVNTGWHGQNTTTGEGEGSAMAGYEAKWTDNDIDNWGAGNNDFGTSGLLVPPSGLRFFDDGSYYARSHSAYLWSSTEIGGDAWIRDLAYTNTHVARNAGTKAKGYAVRCLKD
jgi:uncharacterized protein (TIGR02145 family)